MNRKRELTQGQKDYQIYLTTPWWKARRNRSLMLAGYKCNRCPAREHLHVHHLTYARRGEELDEDLEVLCDICHGLEHGTLFERKRKAKRPAKPKATPVVSKAKMGKEDAMLALLAIFGDDRARYPQTRFLLTTKRRAKPGIFKMTTLLKLSSRYFRSFTAGPYFLKNRDRYAAIVEAAKAGTIKIAPYDK